MGVQRLQRGRAPLRQGVGPREGTFEAHQPSSWSVSTAAYGNFYINSQPRFVATPGARRTPSSHASLFQNPSVRLGRISSEAVGVHTGVEPKVRERPPSVTTVQNRNPALRDGSVSSEAVGLHARAPRTPSGRGRPGTAPMVPMGLRSSDRIGSHPATPSIDTRDAAAMHYEAQFARRVGDGSNDLGSVLAGKDTAAAVRFQREWMERADAAHPQRKTDTTAIDNTSTRADGEPSP